MTSNESRKNGSILYWITLAIIFAAFIGIVIS